MDQHASIDKYRSKRKRRSIVKRIAVLILIAGLASGGWALYRYADEIGFDSEDGQAGFPVSLNGDSIESFKMCGDNIALLTDKDLTLYNNKGKMIQTVSHGYSSPGMKCTSKRCLIYDISGTKLTVESKAGHVFSYEMENKILFGEIAENGNVAILTEDSRYQCRLTVFNENGQEIYRWYSAEKLVTDIDFTGSGSGCVVSAFNTVEGLVQSELYQLDFSKDEEVFEVEVGNSMALSVSVKSDGNIHVVTDSSVIAYSSSGQQIATYAYSKQIMRYSEDQGGYTTVLLGDDDKMDKLAVTLDTNGGEVGTVTIDDSVKDICIDGTSVYILTDEQILVYSMDMNQIGSVDDQSLTDKISGKDNAVYSVNSSQINKNNPS